jgi:hypothetical protein
MPTTIPREDDSYAGVCARPDPDADVVRADGDPVVLSTCTR